MKIPSQYCHPNLTKIPSQYCRPNLTKIPSQYCRPNLTKIPSQYCRPNPTKIPSQYCRPNLTKIPSQYCRPNPTKIPSQYCRPNTNSAQLLSFYPRCLLPTVHLSALHYRTLTLRPAYLHHDRRALPGHFQSGKVCFPPIIINVPLLTRVRKYWPFLRSINTNALGGQKVHFLNVIAGV